MKNDDLGKMPSIRFKGFTNAWELRKLSKIYSKINNAFVGTATPYYVDKNTGFFYLESNNVKDGQINRNSEVYINEEFYYQQRDKWLKTGDIVMVQSGHVGHTAVIPDDLNNSAAHALIMFRGAIEDINPYFVNYQFQTHVAKRKLETITTGNTIKHILASEMKEFIICMPTGAEQNRIGIFFQTLDSLITLHQRKLDKTKELKKTMLSKMFPKNGEDKPELRFSGFTDAWELRRLSELFSRGGSGGTPRSTNKAYYNGKIPFLGISDISNSNGFIDKTEKYITEEGLNNSSAWIVPAGSISLAMYASVGKLAILNTDVATSQAFYNMVFNDENLRNYVYQSLSKANESGEWTKLISTGTQANLNADKVKNFDISKPTNKEEMAMISSFFMDLDNLITLHQRELEKLINIKKTLLKHMFV